jgi:hypothetical protein
VSYGADSEGATAVQEPKATTAAGTGADACHSCGAHLAEEQEWCLECGTARTLIHAAPGWRWPIAIVFAVVALMLAAFVVALTLVSHSASTDAVASLAKPAAATKTVTVTDKATPLPAVAAPKPKATRPTVTVKTVTVTTTVTAPAATTPAAATPKTVSLSNWPPGLGGWTVVMYSSSVRADAYTVAHTLQASIADLGVLNSGDHPSLRPGSWVVFAGRYPNQSGAETAATTLRAEGYDKAHARMVEPPGGN